MYKNRIKKLEIAIIGAGGHAKEVYGSILEQGRESLIDGFYVEPQYLDENKTLFNIPIKSIEGLNVNKHSIHIAVGDPEFRARIYRSFKNLSFTFETVIDPRANTSKLLGVIGEGSYLAPNSTITAEAKIGNCVIINTGAVVSHDCEIQDFCTISPGVILCGTVKIGERSFIGAGSVVREETQIGDRVILGMGSVVIKNILDAGTYIIHGGINRKLK